MFLPIRLKASHWSLVTLNFKINCSGKEQIKNNGSFRIHSVNSEIRIIRHVPGFPPQFVLTYYPFAFICVCVCVCVRVCVCECEYEYVRLHTIGAVEFLWLHCFISLLTSLFSLPAFLWAIMWKLSMHTYSPSWTSSHI